MQTLSSRLQGISPSQRVHPSAREPVGLWAVLVAAFAAAMRDDLLACYAARVRQKPEAHAFLGIDLVLEPTGAVRSVETTGGALLGDKAMKCIVERVKKAKFAPVHGGGTLQIHVPFTFRRVGPDEPI